MRLKWYRYLVTRFEPTEGPQKQMVGFLQAMFPQQMLKSTANSNAGFTKQTLYEFERSQFGRTTYDSAIHKAWARMNEVLTGVQPHGSAGDEGRDGT